MKWSKLKRALAAAQIATQLGTVPVTKDGTPDLVKQYAKYAKHVQLEDIHRQIQRDTTKTTVPRTALNKRTSKRLRKS